MMTTGADFSLNCLPLIQWWKSEWLSRFRSHLCTRSGLLTANEARTFKYVLMVSEMSCPTCGLGGSFQVNSQTDWSKVVNVCWSLSPALPWKHTIPKYNQHTEARPWGRWWFSSSISAFSVDKATATTIQLVFAALLSLHIHVQCAQAMAMKTAVTGPFWFYNGWKNGRILLNRSDCHT